ncbi:hypothetical protein ACLKA6_018452 [Drosophila palustris]
MCLILLFIVCIGMVASRPWTSTEPNLKELQEKLYQQWPGVSDERLADAELDNAYELFKFKTKKPISNIFTDSFNQIMTKKSYTMRV